MEKHKSVSISLSPSVFKTLEKRVFDSKSKSLSNRLASDLTTFWNVLKRGRKELELSFKRSEIEIIKKALEFKFDLVNNESIVELLLGDGVFALTIADSIRLNNLTNELNDNGSKLVKKVETMSDFSRIACIDLCSNIWNEDLLVNFTD